MTDHLFGKSELSFGPCNLYWDTAQGGQNLAMGGFDSLKVRMAVQKIGLREAQAGARDADKAVSAQEYVIEAGFSRMTAERMAATFQGFEIDYATDGITPQRLFISDVVGQRDSSIRKQLTLKEIVDGLESTDPFEIWDFWQVAPMNESVELNYDAETQRFVGTVFYCYKDDNVLDHNGRATYAASRASQ